MSNEFVPVVGRSFYEVASDVLDKIIRQGKPCTNPPADGPCVYGDDEGNHCAVGWIIPADVSNFHGEVDSLLRYDEIRDIIPPVTYDWMVNNEMELRNLQVLHDSAVPRPGYVLLRTKDWPVDLKMKRGKWLDVANRTWNSHPSTDAANVLLAQYTGNVKLALDLLDGQVDRGFNILDPVGFAWFFSQFTSVRLVAPLNPQFVDAAVPKLKNLFNTSNLVANRANQ